MNRRRFFGILAAVALAPVTVVKGILGRRKAKWKNWSADYEEIGDADARFVRAMRNTTFEPPSVAEFPTGEEMTTMQCSMAWDRETSNGSPLKVEFWGIKDGKWSKL